MRIRGLRFRYPGRDGFELGPLDIEGPDDRLCLVLGPSGAGKSTLLRLLAGGLDARTANARGAANGGDAGYLPQLPERALAGRNLAEDLSGTMRPGHPERAELRKVLALTGLAGIPLSKRSKDLSLGERRRVALGLLMLSEARHWALDEPDAGLDRSGVEQLLEVLRHRLAERAGRVWVATHRFERYAELEPWTVVLDRGRLVAQGNLLESLVLPGVEEALALGRRAPFRFWRRLRVLLPDLVPTDLAEPAPTERRLAQVHALLMDRTGLRLTP